MTERLFFSGGAVWLWVRGRRLCFVRQRGRVRIYQDYAPPPLTWTYPSRTVSPS